MTEFLKFLLEIIVIIVAVYLFFRFFGKSLIADGVKNIVSDERNRLVDQYKSEKELLSEKMDRGQQFIENKKDIIKNIVDELYRSIERTEKRIEESDRERVGTFKTLTAVIEEQKKEIAGLKGSTDDLKKILSNNQFRGSFGQEIAEDLLKTAGFVKNQNYTSQEQQESGSKPDFTVLLPDKTKINIDVKFPFQALQRYQETEDKEQQKQYLSEFKNDIKTKIKEVTTRDYINPEEKTVDFVMMFIPNEMIFSFIYEKFSDIWRDAIKNKVVMCGPFGFTAILRMVQQSYEHFRYEKDIFDIVKLIKSFENEFNKFNDEFEKLGTKLKQASDQFESLSTTRTKKLISVIEKIKKEELPELSSKQSLIED